MKKTPPRLPSIGRREVVGDRAARRRLDLAVRLRQPAEPVAHHAPRLGHRCLRGLDDLVGPRCGAARGRPAARPKTSGTSSVPTTAGPSSAYWPFQLGHLLEPDLVDLLRRQVGRRVVAGQRRVGLLAAGHVQQADLLVLTRHRHHVVAEDGQVRRQRGPHVVVDHPLEVREHRVVVDAVRGGRRSGAAGPPPAAW